MEAIHVLVPLKAGSAAKSRLARGLGRAPRTRLVHRMLAHVLDACRAASLVRDIRLVVAGDVSLVAPFVPAGVALVPELPGACGLRGGLAGALDRQDLDGPGRPGVAVVMADLPFLTASALDEALASMPQAPGGLVVADQHGMGTSLLGWRGMRFRDFRYGPGSFAAHGRALTLASLHVRSLGPQPAFHDLDSLDDLDRLEAARPVEARSFRLGRAA
ncbi:MAG: NTP transferase domain-containing protein [Sphingomonadaceae bacterium]